MPIKRRDMRARPGRFLVIHHEGAHHPDGWTKMPRPVDLPWTGFSPENKTASGAIIMTDYLAEWANLLVGSKVALDGVLAAQFNEHRQVTGVDVHLSKTRHLIRREGARRAYHECGVTGRSLSSRVWLCGPRERVSLLRTRDAHP
jgi:hypothetical protein